jgi:hypothetical protein
VGESLVAPFGHHRWRRAAVGPEDGYIFISWKSDHRPRHVHVCREGKLIVKWDLDNGRAMKGVASPGIVDLSRGLQSEGRL